MPGRKKRPSSRPSRRAKANAETSSSEDRANELARWVRRLAFGFVLLSAGLGPLAPTIEGKFVLRLLVQMFLVVAAMLWLLSMSFEGRIRLRRTGLSVWLLLLAVAIVVSTWYAPYRYAPLMTAFLWLSNIVAFVFVLNEARSPRARLLLLVAIAASALVVSLHGIHQVVVDFPELRIRLENDEVGTLREANVPKDMAFDFTGRIKNNRVMGTFLSPNSFAGFLTLVWPACLGLFLDGLRERRRRRDVLLTPQSAPVGRQDTRVKFNVWRGVLLLPFLVSLYLTKSKGGWMGFLLAMVVFGFWAFRDFIRRRLMHVISVVICLVIVLVLAQLSGLAPPIRDYFGSFAVRYGYWHAGFSVIEERPLLGIGLSNFTDAYAAKKRAGDQEARHAHNDYVQMAAEIGLLGLLVYALFWVAFWLRVKRMETEPTLAPRAPPLRARDILKTAVLLSVAVFFLEGYCSAMLRSSGGLYGWGWPVALWLVWTGFVLMHVSQCGLPVPTRHSYATLGMACGIIGFLAHSFVDFDHYVAGINQTAWLMMALLLASRLSEEHETYAVDRRIGPAWRLGITVGATGLAIFLMYGFLLPVTEAQIQRENAMDLTNNLSPRERLEAFQKAVQLNPWDAHHHALLSDFYFNMWESRITRTPEGHSTLSEAIKEARKAAKLNPRRSEYFTRLGRCYEFRWLDEIRHAPLPKHPWKYSDYVDAREAYSRGEALFPTIPEGPMNLARLADLAGDYEAARGNADEAKRLHSAALGKYSRAAYLGDEDEQTNRHRRFKPAENKELQARMDDLQEWTTGTSESPPAPLLPPEKPEDHAPKEPPLPQVFKNRRLCNLPHR